MPDDLQPILCDDKTAKRLQALLRLRFVSSGGIQVDPSPDGSVISIAFRRKISSPSDSSDIQLGVVSNITSLSNGTAFSYAVNLGSFDMTSNATLGGDWTASASNLTYTAFPDDLHAAPINIGSYVSLTGRGPVTNGTASSNGTIYLTIVGAPKTALVTLSNHTSGNTTFSPYTAKTQTGNITLSVWNGFEDTAGSPGPLGVTINANGTVSNGICVVQPIGDATVRISWDYKNSRWSFPAPNSAE